MNTGLKGADDFLDSIKVNEGAKATDAGSEKPVETVAAKAPEAKPVDEIDFSKFTENLGFEVKGWEDIKSRVSKATELEGSLQTLTEELNGYKTFAEEAVDPLSNMSEEGWFIENAKRKYPKLERSVAEKLVRVDAKEMDDMDALILAEALKHSSILREDEAEAKVLNDLKISERAEVSDLSTLDKKLMAVKVREAKDLIAREQEDSKKLPERRTPQDFINKHNEAKTELGKKVRQAYEPIVDSLISGLKEVVKDGEEELITIIPNEDSVKELREFALDQVSRRMLDTSEASRKEVEFNIRAKYLHDNYKSLIKAVKTSQDTKWQKHIDEKYANHKEVGIQKEKTQPAQTDANNLSEMAKDVPRRGWGNR